MRTGDGEVRVEGRELPTPSLMAWRAFRELLEKVVPPPPLPKPLPMPLMGECMPAKKRQNELERKPARSRRHPVVGFTNVPPGENWLAPIFGLPRFRGDMSSPCWGPLILGLPDGLFMPPRPNPPLLWKGGCCGWGCGWGCMACPGWLMGPIGFIWVMWPTGFMGPIWFICIMRLPPPALAPPPYMAAPPMGPTWACSFMPKPLLMPPIPPPGVMLMAGPPMAGCLMALGAERNPLGSLRADEEKQTS